MSRKEDMDKLNSLLAEVNALAEKINKEYSESAIMEYTKPDALEGYKSAFQEDNESNAYFVYFLDMNSDTKGVCNGGTFPFSESGRYVSDYYNPYHMYLSEEYAKKAAKMKRFNDMLLAFKWCHDRTYEPDWSDLDSFKYYVNYNIGDKMYESGCTCVFHGNKVYFSTRIRAEECAEWLNSIDPKGELVI